jgi:GT2 family glycosyltransferase
VNRVQRSGPSAGGFDARNLIPGQQLEPVAGAAPGTWRSRGTDPRFLGRCRLPAGWARIRLRMACPDRARVEIRIDTGGGWDAAECVERVDFRGTLDRDFFVRFPRPIHGVRLDPLDAEGQFRLETFQVQPLTGPRLVTHALRSKLKLLLGHGRTWRALANGLGLLARGRLGCLRQKLLHALKGPSSLAPPLEDAQQAYEAWRRRRQLTGADRERMQAEAEAMSAPPFLSVLLRAVPGSEEGLRRSIASVRRQLYPHWQLCIAADGSAAAWNAVLAEARGDHVALVAPGDELAEQALFAVARAVAADRGLDMLYSDEDAVTPDGRHVTPFFKPGWSPEYLLSGVFPGRLAVYRTDLVREIGGFRPGLEGALEYDLALRIAARSTRIGHIADVLYHSHEQPTAKAATAGRRALEDYLEATGRCGVVEPGPRAHIPSRSPCLMSEPRPTGSGDARPLPVGRGSDSLFRNMHPTHRVRFAITGRPRVTIIIATAYRRGTFGGAAATYIARCLASIRGQTVYPHLEILVLDDPEASPEGRRQLERWGVRRFPYEKPFNWAAAMNQAAARAGGDHLLFLNDDTEVLTPDWLECLLEYSQQPEVGAVGARLEFPDGRLQHVGVHLLDGIPRHAFHGYPGDHPGYFLSSLVPRNYCAVTGACLMTRTEVFHSLCGFTEAFALNFNDIDYCLRVVGSGRRVVCNPYARLRHHEAATKPGVFAHEVDAFKRRWGSEWVRDPFYNPNLSTHSTDYRPASAW